MRHPLLDWYRKVCDFQHSQQKSAIDGLYHSEMTGAVKAYLGLAYDLYLVRTTLSCRNFFLSAFVTRRCLRVRCMRRT